MDLGNSHIMVDGQFVSAKVERVVLAIKDYEPRLEVRWVPPGARKEGQAAFQVVYKEDGLPEYTLFYVQKDEDFDERVLQRIIVNDQRNGAVKWDEFAAWEKSNELVAQQEYLDKMEEANDIAAHILRTNLNTYRVSDDLVIKDGIPFNAAPRRN